MTDLRLATLAGLIEDGWAHVGPTIVGEVAYADFLRTRVFDSWVHEQDVRFALGRPGGSGGLASALGLDQVQAAMGYVVGERAAAPEGPVPTVTLTLSSLDFARLGSGRVQVGEAAARIEVGGDAALGKRILESMNFMF